MYSQCEMGVACRFTFVVVVAVVNWKSARFSMPPSRTTTFDALAVQLSLGAVHFVIILVYRPASEEVNSLYFEELSTVLETLVVLACHVVIGGDFVVKVQLTCDSGARRMCELLTCFDTVQHVNEPTQPCPWKHDLVMTSSTCPLNVVDVGRYSDHSLVVCSLPLDVERLVRGWRRAAREALRRMLDDR